jgi:PAS domain S-box-containing protein
MPRKATQHNTATLKRQLSEANETLRAIRNSEVDALVMESPRGRQVYTLHTADHPYRILVQQMNEGALILSREAVTLHANPRFAGLVRALPEQLIAHAIRPWVAPEDRLRFNRAIDAAFSGNEQRLELSFLTGGEEGERVPVVLSLAPLSLDTVDAVCGVVTDLRERRRREGLERAELMATSVMDHSTAAVMITDLDGRIIRANTAALALSARPVISEKFEAAFPLNFDSSPSVNALFGRARPSAGMLVRMALSGGTYRGIQARTKDANGSVVELHISAGPFTPLGDEISGAIFTLADVTALKNSERQFRALAESIPQIVWILDRSGRLEYCNTVGTEYFGKTVEELAECGNDVVHPADRSRAEEARQQFVHSGQPLQAEWRLVGRDGKARWFLVRALPIRDSNGQITQWFGTSTDVDAQKHVENELRRANADLEHFAYAASHDFQEPLRMVTAFAQMLQKELGQDLPETSAMALNYVLEGTDRLSALLRNLQTYMVAGRSPEWPKEEIDCNEVLKEAMANLRLPIKQSGAVIRAQQLPRIICPRIHLLELFQNLVNNAIKYRSDEPPQIQICVNACNGDWVFSVRDNGIGIAPQHQQNIFDVFKRLHGNNIPGTGMGLAICRRLVEQHGGRIWVESEPNRGSVFHFSLPASAEKRLNESAHA